MKRILAITGGLAVAGAVVGAVVGVAVMLSIFFFSGGGGLAWVPFGYAGLLGAALGSVLGPIAAWTLMRHVPIWRAIVETAGGAAVGAFIGLLIEKYTVTGGAMLGGALIGFVAAALRLRLAHRAPVQR